MVTIVVALTNVSQWTVPADYGTPSTIDCLANGAPGFYTAAVGGSGGGGGAFARKNNLALTPGTVIPISIGGFGAPSADTWFQSPTVVKAAGASGITGGQSSDCIGDLVFSGGNGALQNTSGGGGGGAGPNGAGGSSTGTFGAPGGPGGGGPIALPGSEGHPGTEYSITDGPLAGTQVGSGSGGSGGDQSPPWQVHFGGKYGGGGGGGNGPGTGGTPGLGLIVISYTQGGSTPPPPTSHRRTTGVVSG